MMEGGEHLPKKLISTTKNDKEISVCGFFLSFYSPNGNLHDVVGQSISKKIQTEININENLNQIYCGIFKSGKI